MKITTSGRLDLVEYFQLSGIRSSKHLKHTPFLVFFPLSESEVEIRIVDNTLSLLEFPDATQVMSQWSGQWKSDFFQFTIADLKKHLEQYPKDSHQLV